MSWRSETSSIPEDYYCKSNVEGLTLLSAALTLDTKDKSMTPPLLERKKMNPFVRLLAIICGVIVIALGLVKMYRGIQEIRGAGGDPQFKPLLEETDKAVSAANKASQEAQPLFQQFLDDIDKSGLSTVRTQKKDAAQKLIDLFGEAVEQYQLAAQKSDEAARHSTIEKTKSFLTTKARAYGLLAQARTINRGIVRLVLDDPATKLEQLLPKLQEAAARRDTAQKSGVDLDAEAEATAKKSK
jgi:hypothetical protein